MKPCDFIVLAIPEGTSEIDPALLTALGQRESAMFLEFEGKCDACGCEIRSNRKQLVCPQCARGGSLKPVQSQTQP